MSLGFSFLIIFESFFHKFNTKTNLLPALSLLLLCSLALLQNTVNNAASICGVGNYIVMFWTAILSSLISIFMLSNIHPNTSFYFIIASIFAPRLILYNIRTIRASSLILGISFSNYLKKILLFLSFSALIMALSFFFKKYFSNIIEYFSFESFSFT